MQRGFESIVDVETRIDSSSCPLVLSLATCLEEIGGAVEVAPHLERAIVELGACRPAPIGRAVGGQASSQAVAAYLEYLMPEVHARSPRAAASVGWAVDALSRGGFPRTGALAQ